MTDDPGYYVGEWHNLFHYRSKDGRFDTLDEGAMRTRLGLSGLGVGWVKEANMSGYLVTQLVDGDPVGTGRPLPVGLTGDARQGKLVSATVTLAAVAGMVTVLRVPDWAQGFRLYPRTSDCRFAVGEAPVAETTIAGTDQDIAIGQFVVGGTAKADTWETRLLDPGTNRTVQISGAASALVDVGLF